MYLKISEISVANLSKSINKKSLLNILRNFHFIEFVFQTSLQKFYAVLFIAKNGFVLPSAIVSKGSIKATFYMKNPNFRKFSM